MKQVREGGREGEWDRLSGQSGLTWPECEQAAGERQRVK